MTSRLAVLAATLFLSAPATALAQSTDGYHGPHMWDGGWHGWGGGLLVMALVVALVAAVVLALVRSFGGGGGNRERGARDSSERDGMAILRERFARGEIDREEYEERRKVLES